MTLWMPDYFLILCYFIWFDILYIHDLMKTMFDCKVLHNDQHNLVRFVLDFVQKWADSCLG